MSASLCSTEPVQERAARQINACALLLYPSVPLEVTPALLVLHNRSESSRGMAISKSRQTPTGVRAAPVTLLRPLVLQGAERAGSISALFMPINGSAQEQFLVPVCLDRSQKHREIPSQVGRQPTVTRAGACQACHQVATAVPSKMSSCAEGDDA